MDQKQLYAGRPTVTGRSTQEETGAENIAPQDAARQPTENGSDKWHVPNVRLNSNATEPVVVPCEWCQRPFTPVRVWGRFCRNSCRVMAHYAKKGSK
jgi:hypothetical protein